MRRRAADIEAEPALIDGASYSLHLRFIRAAFSTGTVVASSPAREGGFRMGSRYVTLDRTWLPNGSTHDSTAFLRQNSLTIIGLITTDLAASAKCRCDRYGCFSIPAETGGECL